MSTIFGLFPSTRMVPPPHCSLPPCIIERNRRCRKSKRTAFLASSQAADSPPVCAGGDGALQRLALGASSRLCAPWGRVYLLVPCEAAAGWSRAAGLSAVVAAPSRQGRSPPRRLRRMPVRCEEKGLVASSLRRLDAAQQDAASGRLGRLLASQKGLQQGAMVSVVPLLLDGWNHSRPVGVSPSLKGLRALQRYVGRCGGCMPARATADMTNFRIALLRITSVALSPAMATPIFDVGAGRRPKRPATHSGDQAGAGPSTITGSESPAIRHSAGSYPLPRFYSAGDPTERAWMVDRNQIVPLRVWCQWRLCRRPLTARYVVLRMRR